MMRKALLLLLVLIPAIIIILYFFREKSPFGKGNTSFAPESGQEITKIEFKGEKGSLTLEKAGKEWLVNKKYETRKSSIQFILTILTQMEIKSPVSPELFKNEITAKGIIPVRVKIFDKKKLIRSFLVYKTISNPYGNIMKMRESSKPFIVYVPGNETAIGSAFNTNELFWQPYTVFNILPSDIFSVKFEDISDTSSSFRIKNEFRRFHLYSTSGELSGWDTTRIIRYFSYFANVPFESWAFDLSVEEKEKIEKGIPSVRITVVKLTGEERILTLWERMTGVQGSEKVDSDRLWAKTSDKNDVFVVRYTDIDPLLKKRSYFFPG